MTVEETVRVAIGRLEELGIDYAIGGSFASGVWGHPRQTNDLDIVLNLQRKDVSRFLAAFEADFTVATDALNEALDSRDSNRGFHMMSYDTAFQVDIFLLNESPFALEEFSRRERKSFLPGLEAWAFSAEDTVLQKLNWYVLTNRKSDRQWNDILRILEVREELLDNSYLDKWAADLDLSDLLAKARSEAIPNDEDE